jgi:sugar/nucleoside kinase (ribokinase family)
MVDLFDWEKQEWTGAPSSPSALLSMLIRLPKLKFVIMTLGEHGCVMLERCSSEVSGSEEETDIDELHESLKQSTDFTSVLPVCNSSLVTRLTGNVTGRLVIVTAEKIPSSELIDTTGAGDAFTGALLYGLCTGMALEEMLTFASRVAACCCRGLGARTSLPYRTDPNLATFLGT